MRRNKCLEGFSISVNPKQFYNTKEPIKFSKEVTTPYVKNQQQLLNLSVDRKSLVIMDIYTSQKTAVALKAFKEANFCIVNFPANMTKYC